MGFSKVYGSLVPGALYGFVLMGFGEGAKVA